MRACFVVLDASWSGAARAFADAAGLLAGRGFETCVVAPAGTESERALRSAGHDVVAVGAGGGWLRAGWRLHRVIASRLTEVVFVHGDRAHLVAAAAIRLAGRGAVVRRTPAGESLVMGRDGRLAMRLAATGFVFTHADDVRGMAPPRGALAAHIVPPGVAAVAATPRPSAAVGAIRPDVPRLVLLAGADRRHETLVALRALALLAPRLPALRTTVFAPTGDIDALRLQTAALGVADRVDWRGASAARSEALSVAALAWVTAAADDAVFAMLDALVHGVPVLAERTPLTARFVEDGVSGLLRHRADETEWASVVANALARTGQAEAMHAAARAAAAHWPLDAGADGWLQATKAARDRTRWTA